MTRRSVLPATPLTLKIVATCAFVLMTTGPAWATFPGDNGEILYERAGIRAPYVLPDTRMVTPDGDTRTAVAVRRKAITPTWSPDGSKIAYSTADEDGTKLVVQDFSTEQRDRVLTGLDLPDSPIRIIDVAFGPTGDRLVFCAEYSRGTPSSRLFVVDADGLNLQMISGERPMCHPDWSSTDKIFATLGQRRLFTMNPDGTGLDLLARLEASVRSVEGPLQLQGSWAPDGSAVAFVSSAGRRRTDVWLIEADGSHLRRFTDTRRRWEFGVEWAPDGTALAISIGGVSFGAFADLWVYSLTGGDRLMETPRFSEFVMSWRAT